MYVNPIKFHAVQPSYRLSFGFAPADEIKKELIQRGLKPEQADAFVSMTVPRLGPKNEKLTRKQVDTRLALGQSLLEAIKLNPYVFIENIRENIK